MKFTIQYVQYSTVISSVFSITERGRRTLLTSPHRSRPLSIQLGIWEVLGLLTGHWSEGSLVRRVTGPMVVVADVGYLSRLPVNAPLVRM